MEVISMNNNFVEQQLRDMSKTMKNIREMYGISQSHLANLMGVSRSVIADIEQEKRFPRCIPPCGHWEKGTATSSFI